MEKRVRGLIKESMLEIRNNTDDSKKQQLKDKQLTYKSILEGAQKIAKQTNESVTDKMILQSVKREIKQLNELKSYCADGSDKYNEIVVKIGYCEALLPKMATSDEIMSYLIDNNIEKTIGACMRQLKESFGDVFDGKSAKSVVMEYISQ